jgi:two-component system sensor histidine kinase/response regulator
LATAERLAHTLKGTAGSIGATAVQTEAAALEAALQARAKPADTAPRLERLAQVLAPLLQALAAALPPEAGAVGVASAAPVDTAQLRAATGALRALLADDDAAAEDCWERHAALFRSAYAEQARPLEAAIRGFEFDTALNLLHQAAQARGLEWAA